MPNKAHAATYKVTSFVSLEKNNSSPEVAITTIEEAIAAYHAADRHNPLAVAAALERWDQLSLEAIETATSLPEVVALYYLSPASGVAKLAVLAKWDEMALREISQAMTLNDAIVAHHLSSDNSVAEAVALAKIVELKAQH